MSPVTDEQVDHEDALPFRADDQRVQLDFGDGVTVRRQDSLQPVEGVDQGVDVRRRNVAVALEQWADAEPGQRVPQGHLITGKRDMGDVIDQLA